MRLARITAFAAAVLAFAAPAAAQQLQNSLDGTIRIPFGTPSTPGMLPSGYDTGGNRLGRSGGAGIDLRRTSPSVGGSLDLSNSSPLFSPNLRLPGDLR